MSATQDKFFDQVYFEPARKWADDNGFTLALSALVIYDSFIHSGSILGFLRSRFKELTPKKGGDEKIWISEYVDVRNKWLSTHSKAVIRNSAYRTRDLLREIKRGNWDLTMLPIVANGTPVDDWVSGEPKPSIPPIPRAASDALVPFFGDIEGAALSTGGASEIGQAGTLATGTPATAEQSTAGRVGTLRSLGTQVGASAPVERLIAYREKFRPHSNLRYWAVVNFDLHSSKPRLFLFDTVAATVSQHLCAHGKGSDPDHNGIADIFSNKDGSNCSSLGIYYCDFTYIGEHGKSLYLDGLETSNSAARARHIVMHGATYVSQDWINQNGTIGRSLGCPAIEMSLVDHIIPKLMGGSLLILWRSHQA